MFYKVIDHQTNITYESSEDLETILAAALTNETVYDLLDDDYGVVETPIGDFLMSELLCKICSNEDFEFIKKSYATTIIEDLYDFWVSNDLYQEVVDFGDVFTIVRVYETPEEKELYSRNYDLDLAETEKKAIAMEGEF